MRSPKLRVIGLMSGTSLDGVDAAVIDTDGVRVLARGPSLTLPYPTAFRAELRRLLDRIDDATPDEIAAVEQDLTAFHAEAVRALGERGAALIGLHGQTVLHRPEARRTWQIGDAQRLADETGLPVAHDFRGADVAAGGQGAPFAPLYHAALAETLERPLGVLNLGGVGNLTFFPEAGPPSACDTGPGNALLDDFIQARTGQAMDEGGKLAASGRPDEALLGAWLARPFFALPAPKSLDRLTFSDLLPALAGHGTEDGAATLAAFSARAAALAPFPRPARLLVTGGGRHNPVLMRALGDAFACPVEPVEAAGWNGDSLEAELFAYLAVRVLEGLPLSLPSTTGVPAPMPGGRIARPR